MPRIRSARKALRQGRRRKTRNLLRKRAVHEAEQKFRRARTGKNQADARNALTALYRALDKAAKTGAIPRAASRRMKSRFAKKLLALG